MRENLTEAVDYACRTGSFSIPNVCADAKNVCVFGTGRYFEEAFDAWNFRENLGVNIVCDNDPSKWGKTFNGLPCVSPAELPNIDDLIVIPMVGNRESIFRQMQELGIRCVDPAVYILDQIAKTPKCAEWFSGNRIMDTYDILFDDESKLVYASVLCNRLLGHRYSYRDFACDTEYFRHDIVTIHDDEVFVDCGAYTGDSLLQFIEALNGRGFREILAFEADSTNFVELLKTAESIRERENAGTITCRRAAVWNEAGTLSIGREEHGSPLGCSVKKTGDMFATESVPALRLDDVAGNATFIKMDIEGAELNALRGAEETIKANAPTLTVCLYHQLSDFWEIPMYLHDIMPEYRLYVRHHNVSYGWTVLYACR